MPERLSGSTEKDMRTKAIPFIVAGCAIPQPDIPQWGSVTNSKQNGQPWGYIKVNC